MRIVKTAMNSIPIIFNEHQINRTVLGGAQNSLDSKMPVSVILLNSGGNHSRIQNLENLENCGFEKIISMETNSENYNFEDFVKQFPSVKFIIPHEEATDGELINIGMQEVESDYVLVLRDTIQITNVILKSNVAQKLVEKNNCCYVPRIYIDKNQPVIVNFLPSVNKGVFSVDVSENIYEDCPTLFPLDYIGLYNRKKFIQLGGFDYTIKSPYWQNLDFSFRAWLWGEKISITTSFNLSYSLEEPLANITSDVYQFRFYLKNLLPVFKFDHGEITITSIFRTLFRSSCGFIETIRQFNDARNWVKKNQYRFKRDGVDLLVNWGK